MDIPESTDATKTSEESEAPEAARGPDLGMVPPRTEDEGVPRRKSRVGPGPIRNLLTGVAAAAIILGLIWYFDRPQDALGSQAVRVTASTNAPAPHIGKAVADFEVTGIDGQKYRMSDFRGQPVWLSFWATWCPPCRAENPDIQAVYDQYKPQGLVVLAVSLGEEPRTIRDYATRTHLTYPMASDETTEIAALYRVVGIPTHFFIDRDGILREMRIGGLSKSVMEKKVKEIIGTGSAGN
jgi:cytochrome c biogenesis protein CcmG/thiol:disulfide interchange protein DsbE